MFIFNIAKLSLLSILLIYALVRSPKYYRCFKESGKSGAIYAIYLTFSFILLVNPMSKKLTEVNSFTRRIGDGVLKNYDTGRAVSNMTIWLLVGVASFFVFWLFCNYFLETHGLPYDKNRVSGSRINLGGDGFFTIAIVHMIFYCFSFFYLGETSTTFSYSLNLIFIILIFRSLYYSSRISEYVSIDRFWQYVASIIGFSYPMTILIFKTWDGGSKLLLIQTLLFIFTFGGLYCAKQRNIILEAMTSTFTLMPLAVSLFIEAINIIAWHGHAVSHPKIFFVFYIVIMCVPKTVLYVVREVKKRVLKRKVEVANESETKWKRHAYPCLLIGLSFLSIQLPFTMNISGEIFESANYSILISDFLKFGELPIVSHYGGHMLTNFVSGIIYYLLNGDMYGAAFAPYSVYVIAILSVLFYVLIKYFVGKDIAFYITILIPFYRYYEYYGMGVVVLLALLTYVKKPHFLKAMLLWIACIFCALYRLDIGSASDIAIVIVGILYIVASWRKNRKNAQRMLKDYILSGIVVAAVCGVLWLAICGAAGLDPVIRIKEFMEATLSNETWGFEGIGNTRLVAYGFVYIMIPLTVGGCVLYLLCMREKMLVTKNIISTSYTIDHLLILMFLGISYFTNFSRGMVRHSLCEDRTYVAVWTAYIFIALFFTVLNKKKDLFLPIFATIMIIDTLLMGNEIFDSNSIVDNTNSSIATIIDNWETKLKTGEKYFGGPEAETIADNYYDKVKLKSRVNWIEDEDFADETLREVLDIVLEENETYFDYMNRTFLYSVLGRRCPTYISQSPMQLSGEEASLYLINELEGREGFVNRQFAGKKINLAILPMTSSNASVLLDEIPNAYRYYKVSEYLYENFRPLCAKGEFAFWCRKDKYDEYATKLHSSGIEINMLEPGYDAPIYNAESGEVEYQEKLHQYQLRYLPYIWANYDEKNAIDSEVICDATCNEAGIYNIATNGYGTYIHLQIASEEEATAAIYLGSMDNGAFGEKLRYEFTLVPGENDYLIRVSSDSLWYLGLIGGMIPSMPEGSELERVMLLYEE